MTRPGRHPLCADARGTAVVEFALIAPVMLVLIMLLFDLTYQGYAQAVLTGAVQKAARDSAVQGGIAQTDTIDAKVEQAVRAVIARPTFNAAADRRKNYDNYTVMNGEPFTDSKDKNGNFDGICNNGETYLDINGNKQYDRTDPFITGQGGANDVTQYTVTVSYTRLFPLTRILLGSTVKLVATTVLKNQPYATQAANTGTGTCA